MKRVSSPSDSVHCMLLNSILYDDVYLEKVSLIPTANEAFEYHEASDRQLKWLNCLQQLNAVLFDAATVQLISVVKM